MQRLKTILTQIINSFIIKNGVSIDYSKHTVLDSYNYNSPRRYVYKYFSKLHHFINHAPINFKKPFIIEFEHFLFFCHYKDYRNYKKMLDGINDAKKMLESDLCKGIIIWSNGALREIEKYIDTSSIEQKIHLVRPSIKEVNMIHNDNDKNFRVLNIANHFWSKGTFMVVDAFKLFKEKYKNSILNIVCNDIPGDFDIPKDIIVNKTSKLTIKEKLELFSNSDVFVHPTLQDAYGVYIEALAYELPTISSSIYDKDEVIIDNICGLLIKPPFSLFESKIGREYENYDEFVSIIKSKYENGEFDFMIKEFYQKLEYLHLNRKILKQMRLNCQNHFRNKFSILERNKRINKIYDQILARI